MCSACLRFHIEEKDPLRKLDNRNRERVRVHDNGNRQRLATVQLWLSLLAMLNLIKVRTQQFLFTSWWHGGWGWGNRCTGVLDKSLARPTSRCILLDGENISFGAGLVTYIYK